MPGHATRNATRVAGYVLIAPFMGIAMISTVACHSLQPVRQYANLSCREHQQGGEHEDTGQSACTKTAHNSCLLEQNLLNVCAPLMSAYAALWQSTAVQASFSNEGAGDP
jgi:hypothetical protein